MSPRTLGTILMSIGVGLTMFGLALPTLVPSRVYWDDEQAEEYTAAAGALHAAQSSRGGPQGRTQHQQRLADARARFEKAKQSLAAARSKRRNTGRFVTTVGLLLVVAGGISNIAGRSRD